jgi:hypothetical protein
MREMKMDCGNVIKFSDFGETLGTRALAKSIRLGLENHIENDLFLTFDFDGVRTISNSFADECFAKLFDRFDVQKVKKHTHFKNTNSFVRLVISSTVIPKLNSPVSVF